MSLTYKCLGDSATEDEPGDMFCTPVFGTDSHDFDDGTTPRFHCYGSEETDAATSDIEYSCEPYWLLKPEARHRAGAGWFLWLALQMKGLEREELFTIARNFRDKQVDDLDRELRRLAAPTATPDQVANENKLKGEIEEAETLARQLFEREEHNKARTPEEIKSAVQRELREWRAK